MFRGGLSYKNVVTQLCSEGFLVVFDVAFYLQGDFFLDQVEFIKNAFVLFFTTLLLSVNIGILYVFLFCGHC